MKATKETVKGLTDAQIKDAAALVAAIEGIGGANATLVAAHYAVGAMLVKGADNGSWTSHRDASAVLKKAGWQIAVSPTSLYHDMLFVRRFPNVKAAVAAYNATWKVGVTDFIRGNDDNAKKAAAKKAAAKKATKVTAHDKKELGLYIQTAAFRSLSPAAKAAIKAIVA
jgi:hypothetical protein